MKKFLTVLLALSVVFTYTVGTAFAAVPGADTQLSADQVRAAVENEYKAAVKKLDKAMEDQLETYFPGTSTTESTLTGIAVSEDAVKAVMKSEIYDTARAAMDSKYYGYVQDIEGKIAHKDFVAFTTATPDGDAYPAFVIANYKGYDAAPSFAIGTDAVKNKVAVKEFDLVKDNAEKHIAAIDLSVYSKEVPTGKSESNYAVASRLVTRAATEVANVVLATKDIDGATAGLAAIRDIYTPAVGQAKPKGALYTAKKIDETPVAAYTPGLNNITKISDEGTVAADLAYAKEKVLALITKGLQNDKDDIVDAYQTLIRTENSKAKPDADKIAEYNEAIADTKAAYEAAVETVKYLVNSCTSIDQLGAFNSSNVFTSAWGYTNAAEKTIAKYKEATITGTPFKSTAYADGTIEVSDCVNNAKLIAAAKDAAEKAKAYIELDGDIAIQIDQALNDAIEKIYTTGAGTFEAPTQNTVVQARIKALLEASTDTVKVGAKTYPTVKVWKSKADAGKGYDASMFDELRTIADEAKAAIKAAKTVEEADAAFLAGYEKFDAVPTTAEHAAMFNTISGALKADYDKYAAALTKLATGIETVELANTNSDYSYLIAGDLKTDFINTVTTDMKAKCYTAAELEKAYNDAVATLNTLKTDKQIQSEKDAVITLIKALPSAVTLENKDAVMAAAKALEDYEDYIVLVGADSKYGLIGSDAAYKTSLVSKVNAIKAFEKAAIAKAYAPLKSKYDLGTLTLADKADVEALRTAVDAYVAYYTTEDMSNAAIKDLESGLNVADLENMEIRLAQLQVDAVADMIARLSVDNVNAAGVKAARAAYDALPEGYNVEQKYYDKLVALEKLLAQDVQSLKLTASSKAGKGYIKVTWKVKGNAEAADGYQVFRSTKRNKGYGTKPYFSTKSKSYKNTKSLKKGKRYYYKVRAYKVVDGKKIYSDWSNKAYRTAK